MGNRESLGSFRSYYIAEPAVAGSISRIPRRYAMRRVLLSAVLAGVFLFGLSGVALATPTPHGVTQPGQHDISCGSDGPAPGGGRSSDSPGSPFYGGTADSHYAGAQLGINDGNGQNSQYDIACFQQSAH
jgi:hypothetical protein